MADIEKVIKALEECVKYDYSCNKCPYKPKTDDEEKDCSIELVKDALELLKEQDTVEHACDILRANGWTETEPICSECDQINSSEKVIKSESFGSL